MLFLAHFSFSERADEGKFGHFTCLVEAKSTGAAERAFKKLIRSMRKEQKLFSCDLGASVEIYFDSMTEVAGVPPSGVVSWYTSYAADGLSSINTALPHEDLGGCKGYFYHPSDSPDIPEKIESGERYEVPSFIIFEPTAAERRSAELKAELKRQGAQRVAQAQQRKPFARKRWGE
jgi:hypothetical protein